ncbi:class I SAM-dependent methyltransferase [Actinoallomurus bryophytorum]|uniref:Methyltransferase family protein n=1 Tax=Actinoallomurus bryophytorum TaxID=1490222 RepID=A0A543CC25_9ACTN|nr:class I SAM-dependent methyltransferase [Actinoallomurus bryophytorum]TQL94633.1 methyltransferase family protein [Actinoallomurus bryophytorum]
MRRSARGVERHWRHQRLIPAVYDFVVEHERLARLGGRVLWGVDVRAMYASFAEAGRLPTGAAVLDVPCGGGVAFRGVPPGADLRYVAADLSPMMLRRARAEAGRRGLPAVFVRLSVDRLPFPPSAFDLCVTYNGLHCLPDPTSAVAEMARVLRPGGVLRGSAVVTGAGRRFDALIAVFRWRGDFGAPGDVTDLRGWLSAAGLEAVSVSRSGALAHFSAVKPGGDD